MKKYNQSQGAVSKPELTVQCPTCGKPAVYSHLNPVRPFCSEKCKTGDLAAWASDEYAIPTKEPIHSSKDDQTDLDSFD
jgi:endogenous inhibitor of DNA gyrase (YacG/DUF329 family)